MNFLKKLTQKTLCVILTLVSILTTDNVNAEVLWKGNWGSKNANGDLILYLEIDKDSKESLNPYDDNSTADAYMAVHMVEPSGRRSVLAAYEFTLTKETENTLYFDYKGGRKGVDNSKGKCKVISKGENIEFEVINSSGDKALFDNMIFAKDEVIVSNTENTQKKSTDVTEIVLSILFLLIAVGMIGHMLYLLFRGDRYKKVFTVEDMKSERAAQNKPEQMSEEEYNSAIKLLEEAFEKWSVVEHDENGGEIRKPTKMKQITASALLIDQVIAMQPTEEDIIERLNDLIGVINSNEKRYFDGSKALIWVGVIVGILLCFIMAPSVGIMTLIATGIYVIASRTPVFLIEKRAKRGGGNIHNGFIAGIFAMIAGAQTVRTITTYSDGHKEVDDDNSQHWIAWVLAIILFITIAVFMFVWAFINYIRNYVLYF